MKKINISLSDIFVLLAVIFLAASLIIFPFDAVEAAKRGIDMCLYIVIPSLFPFFVVATFSAETGLSRKISKSASYFMKPIFGLGGSCAVPFILGLIGGYPVGTKATVELYKNGHCTKREAERLLSFCNNSGPAFIFGIVGGFIFGSTKAAVIIYTVHILSSIVIGIASNILFPIKEDSHSSFVPAAGRKKRISSSFIVSVTSSVASMINISGFIIFFSVLICILSISGVIPYLAGFLSGLTGSELVSYSLLSGMVEMTSGVCSLNIVYCSIPAAAAAVSFILGWAGLSVHCQILSLTADTDLSTTPMFIGKLLHGLLSAAISFFIFMSVPEQALDMAAFAPLTSHLYAEPFKTVLYTSMLVLTACAALTLCLKVKNLFSGRSKARKNNV